MRSWPVIVHPCSPRSSGHGAVLRRHGRVCHGLLAKQLSLSEDSIEDAENLRVPVNKGSCHRDDVESWLGLSTHFVRREFSVDAEPTLQFQMLA